MRLRDKVEIEENEGGKSLIVIREVPYGVNRAVLQERIAEPSEIYAILQRYGTRYVVVEDRPSV